MLSDQWLHAINCSLKTQRQYSICEAWGMALSGRDKEMEAVAMQREGQQNRDVSFVGPEAYMI